MSFIEKQNKLRSLFNDCSDTNSKYQKIIELGKALPFFDPSYKVPKGLVKGCQSNTYIRTSLVNGSLLFEATSDALISAGLAALLIAVYDGESPESILQNPPTYLEELGIATSLTPNRANGLYSIHLRMKQEALAFLMKKEINT